MKTAPNNNSNPSTEPIDRRSALTALSASLLSALISPTSAFSREDAQKQNQQQKLTPAEEFKKLTNDFCTEIGKWKEARLYELYLGKDLKRANDNLARVNSIYKGNKKSGAVADAAEAVRKIKVDKETYHKDTVLALENKFEETSRNIFVLVDKLSREDRNTLNSLRAFIDQSSAAASKRFSAHPRDNSPETKVCKEVHDRVKGHFDQLSGILVKTPTR